MTQTETEGQPQGQKSSSSILAPLALSCSPEQPDSTAIALRVDDVYLEGHPSTLLQAVLVQHSVCISFMKAVALLMQPETPGASGPLAAAYAMPNSSLTEGNAPAPLDDRLLAVSSAQSKGSEVQACNADNLEMLVDKAKAAIAATLANSNSTILQLQAKLQGQDQTSMKLHEEVGCDLIRVSEWLHIAAQYVNRYPGQAHL